jgi:anthranilate phosphoribosyltransferase
VIEENKMPQAAISLSEAINRVAERQDLDATQMTSVMHTIMTGGATDAQIGGFLIGLRMKGETVTELTAAASVMRKLATGVNISGLVHPVDIVGTGGDASGTFNVSTASTFVAAAAGCHVAKHGNRAVSSQSGSADVLEAAGVKLQLTAEQVAECVRTIGIGFMFAPGHHSAMKHAIGPRKEMAARTLYNLLGPLTNPAGVPNLLLGVYDPAWVSPLAEVLQCLGANHVMVVCAEDGMDEISISSPTQVAELKQNKIERYRLEPIEFGLKFAPQTSIQVRDASESIAMIQALLAGKASPASDIVALNAGAAIYVAGVENTLAAGIAKAQTILRSGEALSKLQQLAALTQQFTA